MFLQVVRVGSDPVGASIAGLYGVYPRVAKFSSVSLDFRRSILPLNAITAVSYPVHVFHLVYIIIQVIFMEGLSKIMCI